VLTATFRVVSFEQPLLLTVKEYVVLVVGLTVMELVVELLLQEYVPPPEAIIVVELPEQILSFQVKEIIGKGFTVILILVSFEQPLETVREYVLLDAGETIILLVVAPLLQLYVPPPVAISVSGMPTHIGDFPVMVTPNMVPVVTVIVLETVSIPPQAVNISWVVYVPAVE